MPALATTSPPTRRRRARPLPTTQPGIQVVLAMLREQRGLDVVFVRHYTEGSRRFRMIEALHHGEAAAMASGASGSAGRLLEVPVVLPGGRRHGALCCVDGGADPLQAERNLRSLRHGAQLAARLLDNEQVLRELARHAP